MLDDISRYDDYSYWFEEFITLFANPKDELVDAVMLQSHEYLFRFAAADGSQINRGFSDTDPYGQSYRYVRSSGDKFHKVQSSKHVRYVRVSLERAGGHPLRWLSTEVIARDTGYAVAHFAPIFMEFDRARKIELWKDDSPEKMRRLLESQLWSLTKAVTAAGGETALSDIRKTVEVLHTLHRESVGYFTGRPHLVIDIDRQTAHLVKEEE